MGVESTLQLILFWALIGLLIALLLSGIIGHYCFGCDSPQAPRPRPRKDSNSSSDKGIPSDNGENITQYHQNKRRATWGTALHHEIPNEHQKYQHHQHDTHHNHERADIHPGERLREPPENLRKDSEDENRITERERRLSKMLEVDFEEVTQEMSIFNSQKATSLVSDAAKSLQNSIPVLPVVSMPDFGLPPLDSVWSSPVIPSADKDLETNER